MSWIQLFLLNMNRLPSQNLLNVFQTSAVKYPYLVYERNGKILGFAYGSPYQERIAYLYDADLSIYLAPEAQNSGIGQKTLQLPFGPASKTGFL